MKRRQWQRGLVMVVSLLPVVAAASPAGQCGGSGGRFEKVLECPPGQYLVAVAARGNAFVDQLGVRCAAFSADGLQLVPGAWSTAGMGAGVQSQQAACATDSALSQLRVKAGWYLDHVGDGICSRRQAIGKGAGFEAGSRGESFTGRIAVGGMSGGQCALACPPGQALHRITVKYDSWIDSIRGECRS